MTPQPLMHTGSLASGSRPQKRARRSPPQSPVAKIEEETGSEATKSPTSPGVFGVTSFSRPGQGFEDHNPNPPTSHGQSRQQRPAAIQPPQSTSAFRNVSACNRCRLRKNRCDQQLPACSACSKAGVKCVGFDPITKKEIPRSYVSYLESRTAYLESVLQDNDIKYLSAESFALEDHPTIAQEGHTDKKGLTQGTNENSNSKVHSAVDTTQITPVNDKKLNKLVSDVGMVSVQGASDARYLGSTSGISFARVVFAAMKSTSSRAGSERGGVRASIGAAAAGGTSMRDTFFGLHTKPTIKQASFPERELGLKLVTLYFEHANPQIPTLHRGEFMKLFQRVYDKPGHHRTSRESYMLNIVFAIGAGTILGSSDCDKDESAGTTRVSNASELAKAFKTHTSNHQHHPEEYHASAIVHLETFLSCSPTGTHSDGIGGGLEELQAVLLLASFALLRPVSPGLWYIVGVATRLGLDLGLHHEDVGGVAYQEEEILTHDEDSGMNEGSPNGETKIESEEAHKGRHEWIRDLRRRLWWCVYSFDRLVSTCVGRPFGVTDEVITTDFPSDLDDKYISPRGFSTPPPDAPSYKHVSYHYFRLRLLQSEMLQVLQHQQAKRAHGINHVDGNPFMHTDLVSPFLERFKTFHDWRQDINSRLWGWKQSAPKQAETGVSFQPLFLELNYWQAVIMLYRQSLTTPGALAGEASAADPGVASPGTALFEEHGRDGDDVYLRIAEAGQRILKLYRQLHRIHLVNYTFLATHHLFMAGISFLYAIWHSTVVRTHLTLDDVDFTVLAATSVLDDLMFKCPPAQACRDAFTRMSKATIHMAMSTTGFGAQAQAHLPATPKSAKKTKKSISLQRSTSPSPSTTTISNEPSSVPPTEHQKWLDAHDVDHPSRKTPQFDMNLRDLFTENEAHPASRPLGPMNQRLSLSAAAGQGAGVIPPMPPKLDYYSHTPSTSSTIGAAAASQASSSPSITDIPLQQQTPISNFPAQVPASLPQSMATYNGFMPNVNNPTSFMDLDPDLDMDYASQDYHHLHPAQMFGASHGNVADFYAVAGGGDGAGGFAEPGGFDMLDGYFFGPNGGNASVN